MRIGSMLKRASLKGIYLGLELFQLPLEPHVLSLRAPLQNDICSSTRSFSRIARIREQAAWIPSSQTPAFSSTSLINEVMEPHLKFWSEKYAFLLGNMRDYCSEHELLSKRGDETIHRIKSTDSSGHRLTLDTYRSQSISRNRMLPNAAMKTPTRVSHIKWFSSDTRKKLSGKISPPEVHDHSQRAVVIALWCNFLVFCLKCGVWVMTTSHVMLAEAVHSLADLANQALLFYGLVSSRRAPDEIHPYGYSKERFVWSLISAVGIFCLGSGATIVDGVSNLWRAELPDNMYIAAMVIAGSLVIEGASLLVAVSAVRKGASAEGMTLWDYCWRGHDPTAVAVMMEDGAAVTGLAIAGISLVAVCLTGNPIYDPVGSILVGNLLGIVAIFLIQRNRHALLGRAMDNHDMRLVLDFLSSDPVVDAVYDCKSEVIGPRSYRFKAEIDFNGVVIVQNYLKRTGRETWTNQFKDAINDPDGAALERVMFEYGEEVVTALGSEVDRLEREIQRLVPGIQHVDIETHNPNGSLPF
ncbi:hypothetical protein KP509_02G085200 [Ceratopteris richardii]|uniref:Cation efflux protein transmembrane domain-containing protein n=1 Tax=Ceratopteris richardii TaxID=49495 RepID=A0A8T2VB56_CERRI|nr:hypothetical protein KP509_02G085200 [Ceratopteris richardii]